MKEQISVNFVDFWPNFQKTDNYFYHLLKMHYDVKIEEVNPDLVFYSFDFDGKSEKTRYLGTKSKMIYYTGESSLPDWNECDLAFTFNYEEFGGKNYRLPLWVMYLNWFNLPYRADRDQAYLHNVDDFLNKKIDKKKHLIQKTKFCNFVYGKPSGKRVEFFPTLQKFGNRETVSAGRLFNTTGNLLPGRNDTQEKISFLNEFKFTISFENKNYLGYTTEKIIHPMFCNSLPIYWGNSRVGYTDFNPSSFISALDFSTDIALIEHMNLLDSDMDKYFGILDQPWFVDGKIPEFVKPENVLARIESIL